MILAWPCMAMRTRATPTAAAMEWATAEALVTLMAAEMATLTAAAMATLKAAATANPHHKPALCDTTSLHCVTSVPL